MKQTFEYGKYSYDYYIEFVDRKTLGLEVRPDLRIITKVPYATTIDEIEVFLRKKWLWLHKQLAELEKYHKKDYQREYVSGQSFKYLGRQYMLLVEPGQHDMVRLGRGKLHIITTKNVRNSSYNKLLLDAWFDGRRNSVFKKQYLKALRLFNYERMPQLRTRVMARRWGSYTQDNKIALNPKLIEAPTEAIFYVLVHELCHVVNKKHDEAFYKELEKRLPNWHETKQHLEVHYG